MYLIQGFHYRFCFIFFMFCLITTAFNHECTEEIESKQKLVPAHEEYRNYGYQYINEHYESTITRINITCSNVHFPLAYQSFHLNENCTIALIVASLNTTVVPPLAFQKVTRFDTLILDNLGIEKLMPSAFSGKSLKKISLSNNKLTEIGLGIFNHLVDLEYLDLSNNNIRTIHEHSFLGLVNLTSLDLFNNQITNFSSAVLDPNVKHMELLDIGSNKIDNISLENYLDIDVFSLSNNELKEINFCFIIYEKVYLDNNLIEKLPSDECANRTNRLQVLDISFNKISELNSLTFSYYLDQLNISNNNIMFIPTDFFYNMIYLKRLNISHNSIEYLQHGIFDHILNLTSLDVSYNNLSTAEYFYSLSSLNSLYINNNNVNYINPDLFADLPELKFISIDGNKFTCKNLVEITRYLKHYQIILDYGGTRSSSNIHGISCEESGVFNDKPNFEYFLSAILKDMSQQSRNNVDVLKNYFEDDFRNSSFYKFMQKFQNSEPVRFDDTKFYKYLNNDFNRSKFYEYLENLKDTEYAINFAKNVSEFIDAIKNNKFDKYLKNYKIKESEVIFDERMRDYFNGDFEKSKFFKYLENLHIVNNEDIPDFQNNSGYTKLFVSNMFNLLFMFVICSLLGLLVYKLVFVHTLNKHEAVELVNGEI